MTQEEKELLIKDLCARLYYGVLVMVHDDEINEPVVLLSIKPKRDKPFEIDDGYDENSSTYWNFEEIKPYLRPMSSMTEEEKGELWFLLSEGRTNIELKSNGQLTTRDAIELGFNYPFVCPQGSSQYVDWLNAHHFDYRGLIPMGLAIEAPKDMYNNKTEQK